MRGHVYTAKPYNVNRAIAVLLLVLVLQLLLMLLGKIFYSMQIQYRSRGTASYVNFFTFFYPALYLIEIFVYHRLRNKYIERRYANLHLLGLILTRIVLPLFSIIMAWGVVTHQSYAGGMTALLILRAVNFADIVLFVLAHVFFILVILKRNHRPVKMEEEEGSYLGEFEG